jgi:hypothetical protein
MGVSVVFRPRNIGLPRGVLLQRFKPGKGLAFRRSVT